MRTISIWHYIVLSIILFSVPATAQIEDDSFDPGQEINKIIANPKTPEAAAFEKYGNTEVNMFTGSPNISVPVYVYPGRELDLPISLTYDATGVKVEQVASNVGLSWNLNVGGRVSRIVNGMPDDFFDGAGETVTKYKTHWDDVVRSGILSYESEHKLFNSKADAIASLQFKKEINDGHYDTQADYFSFNALGISETFVFDIETRLPVPLNNPRIKVDAHKLYGSGIAPITKWTITGDDGTIYELEQAEYTRSENDVNPDARFSYGLTRKYNSSWLLTKVISPTGKDIYEFEYTNLGEYQSPAPATFVSQVTNQITGIAAYDDIQLDYAEFSPTKESASASSQSWVNQFHLTTIKHNGEIVITLDLGIRYDIDFNNKVERVNVFSDYGTGDKLRIIELEYDYFKTSSTITPSPSTPQSDIRLQLEGITYKDGSNQAINSYDFEYELENSMPSLDNLGQDYYGYFNGKTNTVLYPKFFHPGVIDGADRTVDFEKAKRGMLKKITYPTGGFSEFTYGPNRSNYVNPIEVQDQYSYENIGSLALDGGIVGAGAWAGSECPTIGCQDMYGSVGGPPLISHLVFNVPDNDTYLFNLALLNTVANNPGKDIILFKRSDISSCGGARMPAALTYDQIVDIGPLYGRLLIDVDDVIYRSTTAHAFGVENQSLSLDAGCYQITLVNPEAGSSTVFNLGRNVLTTGSTGSTEVVKAGVRVENIKDYESTGVLAMEKTYSYATGVVISQPIYEYYSNQYSTAPSGEQIAKILHRSSYASGTDGPHIAYPSVNETIVDFTGGSESITTSNAFYIENYGSYFNGIFTYTIEGKQTPNYYSTDYKLGKSKKTISDGIVNPTNSETTKYIEETSYVKQPFYSNAGLWLRTVESNNNMFPIPREDGNGKWYISLEPGTFTTGPNSLEGYVYVTPPLSCTTEGVGADLCTPAIARQEFYFTSAYGNTGNVSQTKSSERVYLSTGVIDTIITITDYTYYDDDLLSGDFNSFLLKETLVADSQGRLVRSVMKYPGQFTSEYSSLRSSNMVAIPVETYRYINDTLVSSKKTLFDGIYPEEVQTAKGNQILEARIQIERYVNGNVVQTRQTGGPPTAYIWGYDKRYVVAQVQNATYAQIEALPEFGTGFIVTEGLNSAQEIALRNLSGALVTSYKHEPLVGVLSSQDPRGYTMNYFYDSMQRLIRVEDQDGNILQEYQYNYKNN
ncbi:hypothetical protein [Gilvibacter sediminis]|uniref:hypothetical protein n=1 Tax=Gilvibacter sediminis TaxID=379071 RepID=UPI002350D5AD|nr:hypothetical protein [Gilvibacter sediminis]MDC7996894.1 hypothetical protein [Gilvibacter sediminis]